MVAVSGDGGFLFGSQELATAVQHHIPVVTVLFNNDSYGNVRRDQVDRYQGRVLGADLVNPDFAKYTDSFGALALRAGSPAELRTALERAFQANTPTVIEVPIDRGAETSPWPLTPLPRRTPGPEAVTRLPPARLSSAAASTFHAIAPRSPSGLRAYIER